MERSIKILLQIFKYVLLGIGVYYLILGDLAVVFMSMFLLSWVILLIQQTALKPKKSLSSREEIRSQIITVIFADKKLKDCSGYKKWSEEDKIWAEEVYIRYWESLCGDEDE